MKLRAACLSTRNIDPMVAFYTSLFGHAPEIDGDVDFRFVPEQLTVFRLEGQERAATSNASLIYAVDDVDAVYARLSALGLCSEGAPTDKPWGVRSFLVRDPDGNLVSFAKAIGS